MKENKLAELSMEFSVDIINLVKYLKSNHESIISNQIGRSGTSMHSLYNTSTLGTNANKLMVPGGVSVTFTLVDNGDDTFTLSYEETAEEPTTVEVTEAPTTEPVTEPATEPTTVPASEYEYTVLEDGTAEVTG